MARRESLRPPSHYAGSRLRGLSRRPGPFRTTRRGGAPTATLAFRGLPPSFPFALEAVFLALLRERPPI